MSKLATKHIFVLPIKYVQFTFQLWLAINGLLLHRWVSVPVLITPDVYTCGL